MDKIGLITEQGDLGFGFDTLNNKDAQVYNESTKNQSEEKDNKDSNN